MSARNALLSAIIVRTAQSMSCGSPWSGSPAARARLTPTRFDFLPGSCSHSSGSPIRGSWVSRRTLTPFVATIDESGVDAGMSANAPLQTDVHYGVRMRMRDQGDSGDGTDAGTCSHIAINNSRYVNVSHHPYWPGGLFGATNELAVASIGIAELVSHPCSLLTQSLTVEFTAAHSNLGPVTVTLEGPGGPYAFDLNPAAAEVAGENWYGTATPHLVGSPPVPAWTFNGLLPCAYLLEISVTVLLTM